MGAITKTNFLADQGPPIKPLRNPKIKTGKSILSNFDFFIRFQTEKSSKLQFQTKSIILNIGFEDKPKLLLLVFSHDWSEFVTKPKDGCGFEDKPKLLLLLFTHDWSEFVTKPKDGCGFEDKPKP